MEFTIDNTSSAYGLTTKNLAIPEIQALLLRYGVTVHLDSKRAVLKSRRNLTVSAEFEEQVKRIEKQQAQEQELEPIFEQQMTELNKSEPAIEQQAVELNNYSWSVLNGFMLALGVGVVATGLLLLTGIPALIATLAGVTIGIAALLTHGLFHAINETKSDAQGQFMPNLVQ